MSEEIEEESRDNYSRLSEEFDKKFEDFKTRFDNILTAMVSQISVSGIQEISGGLSSTNSEMSSVTPDDLVARLKKYKFKNVLLLVGAGISTSAGIPGTLSYSHR